MNILIDVLLVLSNVGTAACLCMGYRELKKLREIFPGKQDEILDRVNFVHECTLLLGRNQNEAIIPRVEAIRGELSVHSGAIRADIAALGKQFGNFAYGARILNARVKKEEAAAAVQEAERTRIAAHRLAQATPAAPVTAEVLMARRKASGLIAPRELNLPQDQMGVKE
jgi:hypothetical protein